MQEYLMYWSDVAEKTIAAKILDDEIREGQKAIKINKFATEIAKAEHTECQENVIAFARRGGGEFPRYVYAAGVAYKIMSALRA